MSLTECLKKTQSTTPVFFYPGEKNGTSRLLGFFSPKLYYLLTLGVRFHTHSSVSLGAGFAGVSEAMVYAAMTRLMLRRLAKTTEVP